MLIRPSEVSGMLQKFYPFRVKTNTPEEREFPGDSLMGFLNGMVGHAKALQWCADNFDCKNALEQIGREYKFDPYGRWSYRDGFFRFASATDATAFKLVWG